MKLINQMTRRWLGMAAMAVLLAACGGGGGGDSSSGGGVVGGGGGGGAVTPPPPPPAPSGPALVFTPSKMTATVEAGVSATVSVEATVQRPADFTGTVYTMVTDSANVILPGARLLASTATQYTATVQTSPSLAAGSYKGTFTVKMCKDSACASQYPGSPMDLPYEFTVTAPKPAALTAAPQTTLSATMHFGDTAAQRASVNVGGNNLQWSAASSVAWAKLSNNSGTGAGAFDVDFLAAGLSAGSYTGEITVSSADGQSVKLPVSLTMLPTAFQTAASGYTFNAVNGAPISSQDISITLSNQASAQWSAASDTAWLAVSPASGTTPGTATLSVDPAKGTLASGTYTANLTLSSPNAANSVAPVQLNLTKPSLTSSVPAITLGGTYGRDFASVPLTLTLNTKTNSWPWKLLGAPPWAQFSATSGSVNESGVTLSVTPSDVPGTVGSATVMLAPQATVNGDTATAGVALTLNRDQRKLVPSLTGVAMVSTPGWSRLSRTLTVSDNFGLGADWSAASDQGWLAAVRTGDTLTLTANPAALPLDTISYATVTLSSSTAGVAAPEKIRIALWRGSAAPAPLTKLAAGYTRAVADPIRPIVYVHNGGSTIDAYNLYTGQKTATVSLGTTLGDMTVSQDGAHLYAYDLNRPGVVVLDLGTMTTSSAAGWSLPKAVSSADRILSIRPNGVELLLTSSGVYRASDGRSTASLGFFAPAVAASMAATPDGKRVYTQDTGASPSVANMLAVDYSEMSGGALFAAKSASGSGGGNGADIAVNVDGSRVYTANGTPSSCAVLDAKLAAAGTLPGGEATPNNVEVDSYGRVYCGATGASGTADVWMHDANGLLLKSFRLAGAGHALLQRQLVVSGDGMLVIGLTDDPAVTIVAVGP